MVAFNLPSFRKISFGSVCAAGSIVFKNVCSMAIVSGNPAQELRKSETVHGELCVELHY
jgi:acetyltransferase-like isoleucine patch superfamily enzyme